MKRYFIITMTLKAPRSMEEALTISGRYIVEKEEELDALDAEFTDRFGPLPPEIRNLIFQIRLKILAEQIGLSAVVKQGADIVLKYPPLPGNAEQRNLPMIGSIRPGKNGYRFFISNWDTEIWQVNLLKVLRLLASKMH